MSSIDPLHAIIERLNADGAAEHLDITSVVGKNNLSEVYTLIKGKIDEAIKSHEIAYENLEKVERFYNTCAERRIHAIALPWGLQWMENIKFDWMKRLVVWVKAHRTEAPVKLTHDWESLRAKSIKIAPSSQSAATTSKVTQGIVVASAISPANAIRDLKERSQALRAEFAFFLPVENIQEKQALQQLLGRLTPVMEDFIKLAEHLPANFSEDTIKTKKRELEGIQGEWMQLKRDIERAYLEKKGRAEREIASWKESVATWKISLPALEKAIVDTEMALKQPVRPPYEFDREIEQSLAQIREEVTKRQASYPRLQELQSYYALVADVMPDFVSLDPVERWKASGDVDDKSKVEKELITRFLAKLPSCSIEELEEVKEKKWVIGAHVAENVQQAIDSKRREIAEIAAIQQKSARLAVLEERGRQFLECLPRLQEIYRAFPNGKENSVLADAIRALKPHECSVDERIAMLEQTLTAVTQNLRSKEWQQGLSKELVGALQRGEPQEILQEARAWISAYNEKRVQEEEWGQTILAYTEEITGRRKEYSALYSPRDAFAQGLLTEKLNRVRIPMDSSLNLALRLEELKAEYANWQNVFEKELNREFEHYTSNQRQYEKAKGQGADCLRKLEELYSIAHTLNREPPDALTKQAESLKALLSEPISGPASPQVGEKMGAKTEALKREIEAFEALYAPENQHIQEQVPHQFEQYRVALLACKEACRDVRFQRRIQVPETLTARTLVRQNAMLGRLKSDLETAEITRANSLAWDGYIAVAEGVAKDVIAIEAEAARLRDNFNLMPEDMKREPFPKLLALCKELAAARRGIQEQTPPAQDGFQDELARKNLRIKDLKNRVEEIKLECKKYKELFEEYSATQCTKAQDDIHAVTAGVYRITIRNEGLQSQLNGLEACSSSERCADWTNDLMHVQQESAALKEAVHRVENIGAKWLYAEKRQLEAKKKELGESEERLVRDVLHLDTSNVDTPEHLTNSSKLVDHAIDEYMKRIADITKPGWLTQRYTPFAERSNTLARKVYETAYTSLTEEKAKAKAAFNIKRILALVAELECLKSSLASTPTVDMIKLNAFLQLREFVHELHSSGKLNKSCQECIKKFFKTQAIGEIRGQTIDPNEIDRQLKTEELATFKEELLAKVKKSKNKDIQAIYAKFQQELDQTFEKVAKYTQTT